MFIYYISTGEVFDKQSHRVYKGGYSGRDKGLNNPAMEAVQATGPIPEGLWSIGPMRTSDTTGPVTMDLTPAKGTDTHGRSLFRIHGDNKAMNHTASHGCIILPRTIRELIGRSGDRDLMVKA